MVCRAQVWVHDRGLNGLDHEAHCRAYIKYSTMCNSNTIEQLSSRYWGEKPYTLKWEQCSIDHHIYDGRILNTEIIVPAYCRDNIDHFVCFNLTPKPKSFWDWIDR